MSRKPFGLDHPSWRHAECFYYATAEEAFAANEKTYGPGSGHTVDGPVPRPVHLEQPTSYPDAP